MAEYDEASVIIQPHSSVFDAASAIERGMLHQIQGELKDFFHDHL